MHSYFAFESTALTTVYVILALLLIAGFGSCFVGNRLRKPSQIALGFVYGYIIISALLMMAEPTLVEDFSSVQTVALVFSAVTFALMSSCYDKFFAFIHGFGFSYLVVSCIAGSPVGNLALFLLLPIVVGCCAAYFQDLSFTVLVPFSGAFFGSYALITVLSMNQITLGNPLILLLALTVVAGVAGLFVQRRYKQ